VDVEDEVTSKIGLVSQLRIFGPLSPSCLLSTPIGAIFELPLAPELQVFDPTPLICTSICAGSEHPLAYALLR